MKSVYDGEAFIPLKKRNSKSKALPAGNLICDAGLAMHKDGKTTDNNRTRQKFCCPFRQSKTGVCPCNHKNWNNGKKNRVALNTGSSPRITGFPLTAAASVSREHTPCVQSVSVTIPALRRLDRNGCGCATAPARQISIRWPTSPPWRLRWPPFCTALTPTVLPNSFGVPPDLSFPYLLQARGSPCYGFCALEIPQAFLIPICLVCGQFLPPVLLISSMILYKIQAMRLY